MKYLKLFFLFLVFMQVSVSAQNWVIFNKEYRYNYCFNNSTGISNVVFVDSVTFPITNTSYQLNRVVRRCNNKCYGTTVYSSSGNVYFQPNMPQFLMRSLDFLPNGDVQLSDTTSLLIKPLCSLNQSWIFDAVNSKTATCIGLGTRMLFGNLDSIRKILINNADSVILSKSFGVIVFPELYNKGKYYRLVGIEGKAYQPTALHGKKLANAWDIYDLNIGQVLCNKFSKYDAWSQINQTTSYCTTYQTKIISKTVNPTGIVYGVTQTVSIVNNTTIASSCGLYANSYTTSLDFGNLSDPNRIENSLYPGRLCRSVGTAGYTGNWNTHFAASGSTSNYYQVGMVYEGNSITFKGFGMGCGGPFGSLSDFASGLAPSQSGLYRVSSTNGATFASGLGFLGDRISFFEFNEINCNGCSFDFTPANFVSISEENLIEPKHWIFKPENRVLITNQKDLENVQIMTVTGTVVKHVAHPEEGILCEELSTGIYLIHFVKSGRLCFEKFCVY